MYIEDENDKEGLISPRSNNGERIFFRNVYYFIVILIVLIIGITVGIIYGTGLASIYNAGGNYYSNTIIPGKDGAVVLLGDSLVNVPCTYYDLFNKLREEGTNTSLGYVNSGFNSQKISNIRLRLPALIWRIQRITHARSDISSARSNKNSTILVILFWDTDCSDVDESSMSSEAIQHIRARYANDVRYVVQSVLNAGAYMAIAGPGVLLPETTKFQMLNEYRDINIAIATSFNMDYIDVRSVFLGSMRDGQDPTKDGEHPNELGTILLAKIFSKVIKYWKNL